MDGLVSEYWSYAIVVRRFLGLNRTTEQRWVDLDAKKEFSLGVNTDEFSFEEKWSP